MEKEEFIELILQKKIKLLTVEQVAETLKVKPNTIERWCNEKKIGYLKLFRRFLIPDIELKRIIEKAEKRENIE